MDHSSFSLTSGLMVTRDTNDRHLGLFAAALMGDVEDPESLAAAVREASRTDAPLDPLTALVWPLLDGGDPKPIQESEVSRGVTAALDRQHNREFMAAMAEAARCLATHERVQGNHMRTLQRAVQFACVSTLAHAQALAAGGKLAERTPALMMLGGHRRSDVGVASERSFNLMLRQFERWLADRLGARLKAGKPLADGEDLLSVDSTDLRKIRPLLARIESAQKGHEAPSEKVVQERVHYYKRARELLGDRADPAQILAQALVDAYVREFASSGGPRRFLQSLGCRVGLLYPHFAGAARDKRYRPSVAVLDMLVRACVPAGQSVTLPEFLARLWHRFGLIVGGRHDDTWDDAAFLAQHDLLVDTPALIENSERLVDELAAMGLARRYADDVTFVGDGRG